MKRFLLITSQEKEMGRNGITVWIHFVEYTETVQFYMGWSGMTARIVIPR